MRFSRPASGEGHKFPTKSLFNLLYEAVVGALAERLGCYPEALRRSITYDKGSENVEHQKINEALGTRSYFCNPYHRWGKGSVEYAIGLIRAFCQKNRIRSSYWFK